MTLPATDRTPGAKSVDRAAVRLRVLVVDDEPDICRVLGSALRALGSYEVHTATDAKRALLALDQAETPFDGIFLDIQMPGIRGIELCSIIRSTPGYSDVPIIMLTAMTEQDYLRDAFAHGANDFIAKPFDLDDIRTKFSDQRVTRLRRQNLKGAPAQRGGASHQPPREVIRSLEDAIAIRGVDRCVTRDAFQTYVLHFSERFERPLSVRVVKIARVHELFSGLAEEEFQALIERLAKIFSEMTATSREVFAYLGNGIFLSSCFERSAIDPQALSDAIKGDELFRSLSEHGLALKVILGREVALSGKTRADILRSLGGVIELAERTETSKSGWGTFREWLSLRKSVGQERTRFEQAVYEELLKDLRSEGGLGWDRSA